MCSHYCQLVNTCISNTESSNNQDDLTPCGVKKTDSKINLLTPPSAIKVGNITYVTGGICDDGVRQMKGMAKDYSLEIVLVERTEENKEVYIADVNVKINDANENLVLEVSTEGPFLLANLPNGKYKITAEYSSSAKVKHVKINNKKHNRIVFLWPSLSQI